MKQRCRFAFLLLSILTSGIEMAGQSNRHSEPVSQPTAPPPMKTMGVRGGIDGAGYSAPAVIKGSIDAKAILIHAQLEALKDVYSVKSVADCDRQRLLVQAAESQPDDAKANAEAGLFYLAHANPEEARPYLQRVHRTNPSDQAVTRALAIADIGTQDTAAVRSLFAPLTRSDDDACDLQDLMALAEESAANFAAASEWFDHAAVCSRSERDSFAHGIALLLLDQTAEAQKVFTGGAAGSQSKPSSNVGLALALYQQGQTSEAIENLLRVAETTPDFTMPYTILTGMLSSMRDSFPSDMIARLSKLADAAPNNPAALLALGCALWQRRDSQAAELLHRALTLDPRIAMAYALLARIDAEQQQYERAVAEYRQALHYDPSLTELHYRLGLAYLRNGQRELGEKEFAENRRIRGSQDTAQANFNLEATLIAAAIRNKAMSPCESQ